MKSPLFKYLAALSLLLLTIGLGYGPSQSDFGLISAFYIPFFLLYLLVFRFADQKDIWFFIILGILMRASLLFALPNLSDDIYRFVWDGRLILNGVNPFNYLPSYYIEQGINLPGITAELFAQLNSPNYFTIYPPVCQAIFASSAWLFPESVLHSAIFMKVLLLAFEIGSIILLVKLLEGKEENGNPNRKVLLYALNPLIIIEITGNLHFEGPMIFFLLLSIWLLRKNRWQASAVAMALSIASKLLPLMFLPFLIRRLGWKKSLQYFVITGGLLLLFFAPLLNGLFLSSFGSSLNLYFQKFEFNASIYYLLRWIGYQLSGYNLIIAFGPGLAGLVLIGILWKAWKEKNPDMESLPLMMLFAIGLYLAGTTTVHPWYAALPLVLCLFTNYRFPVLWTGLIFLTYINYSYEPYLENLWIVGLEYSLVFGFFFYEYKQRALS